MTQFQKILEILSQNKVNFVLIGGLAMVFHGYAGATYDLDFVFEKSPENLKKILKAFESLNPYPRDWPENLPFLFDEKTLVQTSLLTLSTDLGAIDLMYEIPGFKSWTDIVQSSEKVSLGEFEIQILSIDGLIQNKKATARSKDKEHVLHLEEMKKIEESK